MKTMRTGFSTLAMLLIAALLWANPTTVSAQAELPPGAIRFDFDTSNGVPLTRGMTIDSITVDGLTMGIEVDSNRDDPALDTAMIFDTSNPGTDLDLGAPNKMCNFDGDGDPSNDNDGPGEGAGGVFTADFPNCKPLGNVLIIPEAVPFIPADGPDDDSGGGVLTLTFDVPVRVLQIDILDIDEPSGNDRIPRISFLDINGTPIEFVDVESGQSFTELRPDVAGDNGYEEFLRTTDFRSPDEDKVHSIRGNFIGSGALAGIVVIPNPAIAFRKFVNGFDANDPEGSDVPRLRPTETVTWTYHVTNTGSVPVPFAQVVVTDTDPTVFPEFNQVLVGNADDQFEPGEVWEYMAIGQALNLTLPGTNPSIKTEHCPKDDGSTDKENGYNNVGTVTVPGAIASDPANYCGELNRGLSFIKFINGNDANDPAGPDVPRLAPGDTITWTYHASNTGDVAYPLAQVIVTDTDPTVLPVFNQVLVGNADELFERGETWEYIAQSQAIDLSNPAVSPSIKIEHCPRDDDDTPGTVNGYNNIGTVSVPGASATDPANYCPPQNIEFRKFVNGFDANTAESAPIVVAGAVVTWTYHVTNTGEISFPRASVIVTDSDPLVEPVYNQVLVGDADDSLEPDEVWEYIATGIAPDPATSSSISIGGHCLPDEETGLPADGYKNNATVTVPGIKKSDPAIMCYESKPALIASRVNTYTLSYTVINPPVEEGGVPVENVTVRAASPEVTINCTATALAAGESMTCPATANNIAYRNSRGWVTADPVGGGASILRVILPDASAAVTTLVTVNGQAVDSPPGPLVASPSAEIVVQLHNNGADELSGLEITLAGAAGVCEAAAVAPNATTTCRVTADVQLGPQVLTGSITALSADGSTVSETFQAYLIGDVPAAE